MKVISVVNNLACWFDYQMLRKAACTIDNCDSVGISIIISISQFLKLELNLKIGIIPIVKRNPVVYCKFMSILYLTLAVSGNLTTSSNWYLTSSFLCKNSLNLKATYIISLRTFSSFFIADPEIKRFNTMSTDSSCLTGIFGLVVVLLLLNLHANFLIIKSLLFSAPFFLIYHQHAKCRIAMLFWQMVWQLFKPLKIKHVSSVWTYCQQYFHYLCVYT